MTAKLTYQTDIPIHYAHIQHLWHIPYQDVGTCKIKATRAI